MQAQEQLQPMQDTIERIYGDAQVQLGIAAPTPEMGTVTPGAAKVRVRHDLKPWELSANATPSEFRRWRRKYEQYYLGSDIGSPTYQDSRLLSRAVLTANWSNTCTTLSATTPPCSRQNPTKTR